jgi:activator of HSP90 ATPase
VIFVNVKMISQKIIIAASPEEAYDAYMDEKKHSEFTGSDAKIDPKVGGRFTAWDGYIKGKNIELVRGRKIVQEWATSEWPGDYPPSRLELSFSKVKTGTEIAMEHSGVPVDEADEIEQGWIDFYWEPLKTYFKKR